MTKRRTTRQIPAWMASYYANSISGSVSSDYAAGRVITVNADANRASELQAAETELTAATDEVNRQYWLFTRCTKSQPVSADASRRQYAARQRVMDLRSGR